jgi:hypothetical protein
VIYRLDAVDSLLRPDDEPRERAYAIRELRGNIIDINLVASTRPKQDFEHWVRTAFESHEVPSHTTSFRAIDSTLRMVAYGERIGDGVGFSTHEKILKVREVGLYWLVYQRNVDPNVFPPVYPGPSLDVYRLQRFNTRSFTVSAGRDARRARPPAREGAWRTLRRLGWTLLGQDLWVTPGRTP